MAAPPTEGSTIGRIAGRGWGFMKGLAQRAVDSWENLEVQKTSEGEEKETWEGEQRSTLWSRMKQLVGEDIVSMVSLPVWLFEPMSFLQNMAEPVRYIDLLQKASQATDPDERMALVAAFCIASYSTICRTKKPFNPILGETFEIVPRNEDITGYRFFAEQVSHHPPIAVAEITGHNYNLVLETAVKSKFYGNSAEVNMPDSENHLDIAGEHIKWAYITTSAHNIIIGSMYIDHHGELTIENITTGGKVVLTFTKCGWLGAGRYEVVGDVFDSEKKPKIHISGKWSDAITMQKEGSDVVTELWRNARDPVDEKWKTSKFVHDEIMTCHPDQEAILPVTDSRKRTDRKMLEDGVLDKAGTEKHRLEEKQRAAERARKASGEEYIPKYFHKAPHPLFDSIWLHRKDEHNYWTQREKGFPLLSSELIKEKNLEPSDQ